ncbi:probable receptor-like cytoplasmic kinase 185 at N-terminal half [Coccomyxa sp. Obi]|nr:probable receptor-like cytoplasmic kinase 185 at N-terminal half [Coccomyxa sp. Obi]
MAFSCFGGGSAKRKTPRQGSKLAHHEVPLGHAATTGPSRSQVLPLGCKYFTYRELEEATNDWAQSNVIGDGGFGRVYKGRLRNGLLIAAKRLDRHGLQGDKEFNVEVSILSRLHHPSIVKLLGVCVDGDQRIAVFELLSRGSLSSALDLEKGSSSGSARGAGFRRPDRQHLTWQQRVQIALGLAHGLAYMHQERLVHRDVTSGNVLLTEGAHARIADLGLAQRLVTPDSIIIAAPVEADSILMGTYGYVAPEYAMSGELSQKIDVYAFGVVLLEILTAKPAVDGSRPPGCQLLSEWLLPSLVSVDKIWEHLDPALDKSSVAAPQLATLADVAQACLSKKPSSRPRMEDVVRVLETAAAFVSDASSSIPTAANGAATNLVDAAVEPLARFPGFEDPFASNPFASSTSESSELHTPLSTGMPGASAMDSPARDSTPVSSAASLSTPLRTPFAPSVSPIWGLSRLSASRAAHCLPKAHPEDFASPLQSGLRFGVMSQVSPDVGSAIGPSSVSEQVIDERRSIDKELSPGGASPLFEALASRQNSPANPSVSSQHGRTPSQSADQAASSSRNASRSLDYQQVSEVQPQDRKSSAATEASSSSTNPFLDQPVESSFAAAVRRKDWRSAGPASAPAYAGDSPGISSASVPQNRQRQRGGGGPLADSVASLTVSRDRPIDQRAHSHAPEEIFGALQPIADEEPGPSGGPGIAEGKQSEGVRLSPSVGPRRSSGNPFKDEDCSSPVALSPAASGNPFAVASGDVAVAAPGRSDMQLESRHTEINWPCAQLDPTFLPQSPKTLAA